jgi:hypothetical protein
MYHNNIYYILGSVSAINNSIVYQFVSLLEDQLVFPNITLEQDHLDLNTLEIHYLVLGNIVSIDIKYLELKLLDIQKESSNINIYYLCDIPQTLKINNAFLFTPAKEIFWPIISKAKRFL